MKKLILASLLFSFFLPASAAEKKTSQNTSAVYDTSLFNSLRWRNIGPWRGGRCLAVAGVASQPNVYYSGAVGGGLWKTIDAGQTWVSISDSAFHSSSVGAIEVSSSNPNIIYAGMGEAEMRGNISFGDGLYKSTDAGRTWKHMGLKNSYAISTILIHPSNPDIVYACCMGKIFGTNGERGLYRSRDGGVTWQRVLFRNDSTGCVSAAFDPSNPNILYATLWQACRTPYSLSSGGSGSGMFKSTDGGDSWTEITRRPGLPVGLLGRMHVATTAAKPERIYASVESEHGGIFRSDDRGEHWIRTTDNRNLRKRPWYFSVLVADPQRADVVWCLNVQLWRSMDGGMNFSQMPTQHGDHHDLWINPKDPDKLIQGDDGGAYVSQDGGRSYTDIDLPTAQFYHVSVDNDFPYNVYGAQQDNSSIRIASATDGFSIGDKDWYPVAGGEAGYIVSDPENPDITFGGEYDGQLSTYNKKNNQYRLLSVWPESNHGHGSEDRKYRFNWTFPIVFSPFDPKTIYVTSQFVHRSTNKGASWEIISPDLTRHDPKTMKASGGPITKDNTGAEAYANIFAFAESPVTRGVFWAGSDDGLVHVSRDGGKNWSNVTPAALGNYALISIIEPSHADAGTCYLAANRYKADDTKPYLFRTRDYGASWELITTGIPGNDYTRVIREDPDHTNILYAGTETGVYISFNRGNLWQPLKLNLPVTPVHDIQVQRREHDLVIATHGRSFWILDDLTPLYQLAEASTSPVYFYAPRHAYRKRGAAFYSPTMQVGENAPTDVLMHYYFREKPEGELLLRIFDASGDTVITYSSQKDYKGEPVKIAKEFHHDTLTKRPGILTARKGSNNFIWDTRYPDSRKIEMGNNAFISGGISGPTAVPGLYTVKLYLKDTLLATRSFELKKDPRVEATPEDLKKQFDLLMRITKKQTEASDAINKIRRITKDINASLATVKDSVLSKQFKAVAQPLLDSLKTVEEQLTQPKAVTDYDLFNYPNMLNDKLAGLRDAIASADAAPTPQSYAVFDDLSSRIDAQVAKMNQVLSQHLADVNRFVSEKQLYLIREDVR